MAIHGLLHHLAGELGIDALVLDDEGLVGLRHPSGREVMLQADEDRRLVHLCAVVAPIPALDAGTRYAALLRLSSLRRGPYEPVFAVERETRSIALTLTLPLEAIDGASLAAATRTLVERCAAAERELGSGG